LSPRASREEVLVPGVRPAPSDDEDEEKVNAVKKKKLKKQPSKLGRTSSSQMQVASAGSGEVGGKSSGGDAPTDATEAKKGEKKKTITPANNEKNMPPKKRKLAEDGTTQKNEMTEEQRESLRNEECYRMIMENSTKLPTLKNASGDLAMTEESLMKQFAAIAKMKEGALKVLNNKLSAKEEEMWDRARKHLANALASKDYDKLYKSFSTNDTTEAITKTTPPNKTAKTTPSKGGKLPAIGSKVDPSKSKITGTFDAGYFVDLVIDGKKCSGIAFSPVLQTTTDGGSVAHRIN